jgi:hypothetical protein
MGQKAVLLGFVKAVDFINEQERALPILSPNPGLFKDLFQVWHPGEDG